MESFIREYISSVNAEGVQEELLLDIDRRISPYATLRPGDLSGLLKLHSFSGSGLKFGRHHAQCLDSHDEKDDHHVDGRRTSPTNEDVEQVRRGLRDVVCRGEEQNHVPAVYTVRGLRRHEMPVIGVYVDSRVCPGFRYRVRRAGSDRFFFRNEARTLESVGMGYGKRLTFTGDTLNNNDFYFWSDSEPNGYAFSIQALDAGQKLLVLDQHETVVGEAVVAEIHEPQEETDMTCSKNGVTKRVHVRFTCSLTYYDRHHHGLAEIMVREDQETLSGDVVLHKAKRARKASLLAVENVFLKRFGQCKFVPEMINS